MSFLPLIHPILFLLASILYLYPSTFVIASPDQMLRPLLVLLAAMAVLVWPARWMARDWDGAGVLLSAFVLGVCAYSPFTLKVGEVCAVSSAILFLAAAVRRKAPELHQFTALLAFIAGVSVVAAAFPVVGVLTTAPAFKRPSGSMLVSAVGAGNRPDIYYIVLDGYARTDILAEFYGVDNSDLVRFLKSRGFTVPTHSRANYGRTALSIASTLNMDYVETFAPGLQSYPYWWLMAPYIDQSRVRDALEALGYRTVSLATDWSITDNPTTDAYYSPKPVVVSDFEYYLLELTPLGVIRGWLSRFATVHSAESHRALLRFSFHTLGRLPGEPGPKFVYAHIIAPHPPFVVDGDGREVEPGYSFRFSDGSDFPLGRSRYREGYRGQMQFVNGQLKTLVDDILRNSPTPPVILLQADHGPGMLTSFSSVTRTCLRERLSVFGAYYLPGTSPADVPSDVTPVNLFRIVFNRYFAAGLPLLPNEHYHSEKGLYAFRSSDVTSMVDTCTVPREP